MNITDELLMAYADNEVDDATREQIERAIDGNPALQAKVAQHRALRAQLSAALDPVLAEPVPERLKNLAANQAPGGAIDLAQARVARQARKSAFFQQSTWISLAASMVLGVAIGFFAFSDRDAMIVAHASGLVAGGELEQALAKNLASDSAAAADVHIGISYVAKSGEYCRSFAVRDGGFAGFACRDATAWRIRMLAPALLQAGEFRTAASAIPESVLAAITQDIQGEALDAEDEARAAASGWKNMAPIR